MIKRQRTKDWNLTSIINSAVEFDDHGPAMNLVDELRQSFFAGHFASKKGTFITMFDFKFLKDNAYQQILAIKFD
jgi:hypothetical protein